MSLVCVISGPSGTGKSSLVKKLQSIDGRLSFATSVTTRTLREREVDGKDYRFVTPERFESMRENGELLEWEEVFGNLYGTPWSAVERARAENRDLLLDIDVKGAASLRERLPDAVEIFVLPPSRAALEQRLRGRSSDDEGSIARRLGEASREVSHWRLYDHIVINADVEEAARQILGVLAAARGEGPGSGHEVRNAEGAVEAVLQSFGLSMDAS